MPKTISKSVTEAMCHVLKMDNFTPEIEEELKRGPVPLKRAIYYGSSVKTVDFGNANMEKIHVQYDVRIQFPHKYRSANTRLGVTHGSIVKPPRRVIGGRLPLVNRSVDFTCTSAFKES